MFMYNVLSLRSQIVNGSKEKCAYNKPIFIIGNFIV